MTDDIAALLTYLEIGQADVMGYSPGGAVALQANARRVTATMLRLRYW